MRRDLDTSLLRTFVAVADAGGMTKAAKQVHRTQAAVSQQIKRLEEQLGQELFDRSQRSLSLSPAGEQLLGYAQRMLALNDDVWDLMTSPAFEGTVRLGIPHDLVPAFAPPILKSFARRRPRIRIAMTCGNTPDLRRLVDEDEIDLTLTTEIAASGNDTVLLTDRLVWAGAANTTLPLQDMVPVAIGGGNCAFRPYIKATLDRAQRPWRAVLEDTQMEPLVALCEADLAIMATLTSTLPHALVELDASDQLGKLPNFYVNLHEQAAQNSLLANELARHIKSLYKSDLKDAA